MEENTRDQDKEFNNNGQDKRSDNGEEYHDEEIKEEQNTGSGDDHSSENDQDINKESHEETSEEKISRLEGEVQDAKDKHMRLYAEFENFRRRTQREKQEMASTASQKLIKELLPVVDDMERAKKAIDEGQDFESVKEGIELVIDKFFKTLNQEGLEAFESKGKEFNSDYHEAISTVPAPSEDMKGKVVDEVEKGYYLNGKLIRFAKVVIGE